MKNMLQIEFKKAFKNKLFVFTLFLATAIAIYSAAFCINGYYKGIAFQTQLGQQFGAIYNPQLAGASLFNRWIGLEFISPAGTMYYLVFPLLACFPYAWSYFSEHKSGYIKNIATRTNKKTYFISKYIAVFFSGGITVLLPIIMNFMIVSSFVPAIKPDAFSDIYYGIHPWQSSAALFYEHPYIFILLNMVLTFLFSGLVATMSLAITFFFKNKFAVLLAPFFIFLSLNYISSSIQNIPEISPIQFLHSSTTYSKIWIMAFEAILIFGITFFITVWRGKKDDIF